MKLHEESDAWLGLAARAEGQYGLVTREELDRWFSRHQVRLRSKRGLLLPAAPGVWRLTGAPTSWRQRVMAACLSLGQPLCVSHATAGRLWEFDGIAAKDAIELAVPPPRAPGRALERVAVHRTELGPEDRTQHLSIPVTSPARTLADLAASIPSEALARAMDYALREHLTTVPDLRRQLVTRTRMKGSGVFDELVTQREAHGVGDSEWEDTVLRWLIRAGLPLPRRHHKLSLARRVVVLDFAYPEDKVAVEFDGFEWHKTRTKFDRDRARLGDLAAAGWMLVPVTSSCAEEDVVDRVRRALTARAA
jgi:hypothetical protein